MAEALVSAATGALQPVLGKLGALLGEEYKRLRSIHTEINLLTLELKAMDAFLEKMAEEEDPNPQDKNWMNEVRELSYDVEDNLDEFMARVIADKVSQPDGFMDRIKGSLKRLKARHDIAKVIEDLKKQAIEVSQRNARYRSGEAGASNASSAHKVDVRALAIFEDASKLIGVDGPKREIIQLLADCEATKQQPNIVAIVGSGGLGKTTVANRVYQELKGQFKYHAFLSVSRNPDIARVMSNIYGQLDKDYSPCTEILQTIITKIRDFLENERYLIVVDDVWKEDDWKAIKCAFPETSSGSKIITTTRINDVAKSCCPTSHDHIYNLKPLNMMQSRQLLYARLFYSEEKCPPDLKEISGQILEKCAGLPLAIVAISGVLADKKNRKDQWEGVKDSIGRALRNSSIETLVNIISLSYLDLPPNLRTCLLYLSIFPEDHIISKDNLIRRWIGEGFIHKQKGHHKQGDPTPYEIGDKCFTDLINRSLIQPAEIDRAFGGQDVKSCRVHDTVLDFVVSKAVEENFVTIIGVPGVVNPDPGNTKVRRLSLQNDGEIPPGLVLSHARSLHVFGRSVKIPSLSVFRLLRVLDYDECGQLDDDDLAGIGKLLHLKYLRFRHAHLVTELLEELARLGHLEIDIHGFNVVMKIPEIIQKQLVCYVTVFVQGWKTLHDDIASIQGLRVLEGLSVYNHSVEFLQRLGNLKDLRKLSIEFVNYKNDDELEKKQDAAVSSVNELGKASLESLHITTYEGGEVLDKSWFPSPPCGLRELVMVVLPLPFVPEWMGSLVSLEKLRIIMPKIREKDVEILGALPSLRYISIRRNEQLHAGEGMEAVMERAMEAHPNRPTLDWEYYL